VSRTISFGVGRTNEEQVDHELFDDAEAWAASDMESYRQKAAAQLDAISSYLGPGTTTIYVLITLAALFRLFAPLGGTYYVLLLSSAGAAWSGAFGLFVLLYARPLALPGSKTGSA
jgi:hypothetical protein